MNERVTYAAVLLMSTFAAGSAVSLASPYQQTAPAAAASVSRLSGSLEKVDGKQITLKDAQGAETTIVVTDATKLLRIAPGQTSLAGATPIQLTDMTPGDRLLVLRISPLPDGSGNTASAVVAMKQTDIAQQRATETAAWQHGVGGLVKSVDVDGKAIQIASGAAGKSVTIKLGPSTIVKRYAAESVQYDQAKPSSLDKIMVGDQLRARGTSADLATFQADEIVAGSFRNFSGKITAIDASGGMITLNDLATKQPVQLKVTSDSQLRKLDDATADKLAAAMKPAGGEGSGGRPSGGGAAGGPPSGGAPSGGEPGGRHGGGSSGQGSGGADMQQALAHAPAIQLAELKRGDLVMVVASSGADNQMGAVTVVTGVEPLLRASPSASAAVLSSWSLGGGGAGAGAAAQ